MTVARAVGTFGEVVAAADVGRTATDRVALVGEQGLGDAPPVVHVADHRALMQHDVVEELLAELE